MLRNKSTRAVSSKQGVMADNSNSPISSLLGSPKIFNGLFTRSLSFVDSGGSPKKLTRSLSDVDSAISPKSILENRQMFNLCNPFGYDRKCANYIEKKQSTLEGVKLALLAENMNTCSRMVLKVHTPPTDFGIKTRDPQLLASYETTVKEEKESGRGFTSLKEMENSEEYTCVITHGPNPKTTHIFDDCVVECCCVFGNLSDLKTENHCDLAPPKHISCE